MADKTVIVISTTNCPKCAVAKRLLTENGVTFMAYDMSDLDETQRLTYLNKARAAKQMSLPLILVNDEVKRLQEVLDEN